MGAGSTKQLFTPHIMKTQLLLWVLALCLGGRIIAVGGTPSVLSIQTYSGLTITGAVGTIYIVQYTTNLGQPSDWRSSGVVQLPSSPFLWVDPTAAVAGYRAYRAVEGPTNLVWIPPGTFTMGSPSNEVERYDWEGPQTVVTLTRGFFMGKYELTQGEYLDVVGHNPSYFRNGKDGANNAGSGAGLPTSYVIRWRRYCGPTPRTTALE